MNIGWFMLDVFFVVGSWWRCGLDGIMLAGWLCLLACWQLGSGLALSPPPARVAYNGVEGGDP